MKTNYKVAIALVAGAAIGGAAIQGLHAQAKPTAYVVTENEVNDEAAFKEFGPKVVESNKQAGGKYLVRGGRVVVLEGAAPKRYVITAYDSMEKAQAWADSPAFKDLAPLRAKAIKNRRAFIVEGLAN